MSAANTAPLQRPILNSLGAVPSNLKALSLLQFKGKITVIGLKVSQLARGGGLLMLEKKPHNIIERVLALEVLQEKTSERHKLMT